MTRMRRKLRGLGSLVAAAAALSAGCLSCLHPTGAPLPDQVRYCRTLPPACRNHVYVFFLHGIDPLDCSNLSGVRDYVQELGFIKTYYAQFFHAPFVAKEIRRLHEEDPSARFALVGFDYGAKMAAKVADAVQGNGILIDLVIYLGGSVAEDKPANVGHVVNIMGHGWTQDGVELSNAVNLRYADVSEVGTPTYRVTLETLAHELTALAARVPVIESTAPGGTAAVTHDDWDFLKLRSSMEEVPLPDSKPGPTVPEKNDKAATGLQRAAFQGWVQERE